MNDIPIVICCVLMLASVISAGGQGVARFRQSRLHTPFLFCAVTISGWIFSVLLYRISTVPDLTAFAYMLGMPLSQLATLSLLLFVVCFCGGGGYLTRTTLIILFTPPAMTLALVLVNPCLGMVYSELRVTGMFPRHAMETAMGVWYPVILILCYLYGVIAIAVIIAAYGKMPARFRTPSRQIIIGLALVFAGHIAETLLSAYFPFDYALLGMVFILFILLRALRDYQDVEYLTNARSLIFNELDQSIFILAADKSVIERNLSAKYLLYEMGLDPEERSYENIFSAVTLNASRRGYDDNAELGDDYLIDGPDGAIVTNIREKFIEDRAGRILGSIVFCTDVTEISASIRKLETVVGVDAMTGLLNRRRINDLADSLKTKAAMPLLVISGDVNGLKDINDRQGHQMGDAMLRAVADAMTACCPPGAHIARTGGDEFLILIANHTPEQGRRYVRDIQALLQNQNALDFPVSVALGVGAMETEKDDMEAVMAYADRQMYEDKRRYYAGRE